MGNPVMAERGQILFTPRNDGTFEVSAWTPPAGIWRCEDAQTFPDYTSAQQFAIKACLHTGSLIVWPAADMAVALAALKS